MCVPPKPPSGTESPTTIADLEENDRYEVTGKKGALVRSGVELTSDEVGCVEVGLICEVTEEAATATGAARCRLVSLPSGTSLRVRRPRGTRRKGGKAGARPLERPRGAGGCGTAAGPGDGSSPPFPPPRRHYDAATSERPRL